MGRRLRLGRRSRYGRIRGTKGGMRPAGLRRSMSKFDTVIGNIDDLENLIHTYGGSPLEPKLRTVIANIRQATISIAEARNGTSRILKEL